MDFEKNRRRQNLKVIVSEAFMVLAVIITVIILAFIVSGYWVNSDFEVKRQGLLQISSTPTGADVDIDGDSSWLQKTNTSKVLSSGEHTIVLKKEGYDSWQKTVNIKEGLLYRIHYPRLFLLDRYKENAFGTSGTTFATVSPDRSSMILVNNTTEWAFLDLDEEKIVPKKIDISPFFSEASIAPEATIGVFTSTILDINWDANNSHVLFKVETENGIEWVLLNPKDIRNSLNLTREFGANFSDIKIFDNDSNTLLAVQNNNLHKIDVSGRSISAVLVESIINYDYYHNEIFFSALKSSEENEYYIGTLKPGDEIKSLKTLTNPALIKATRFYEERYIVTLENNLLTIYKKDDFEPVFSGEISFIPSYMKIGHDGEFVLAYNGSTVATLDMESMTIREWLVEGENFGWLDDDMIYTISNNDLIVYDFDGLNRRVLTKNVSNHFPVTITNNRYLYYFNNDSLIREWLIPR